MIELEFFLSVLETAKTTGKIDYLEEKLFTIEIISERLDLAGFPSENETEKKNLAMDILVSTHLKHCLGILEFTELPAMSVVFQKLFTDETIKLKCSESSYNDAISDIKKTLLIYL